MEANDRRGETRRPNQIASLAIGAVPSFVREMTDERSPSKCPAILG
jgi:hypothetical protein